MREGSCVVVFPSIFSAGRLDLLERNVKRILEIKGERHGSVTTDDSVITIEAEDPVFASSAAGLLFGTRMVAISTRVKNDFDTIVAEITKTASRLLLKGDRFRVKVEGSAAGFLPKDVEMAATSSIIAGTAELGVRPGTAGSSDKTIYVFLTRANAYVCIFTDAGLGGIPYGAHDETVLCVIFDGLSAVSCFETIKQGFRVRIAVCYRTEGELRSLAKATSRILPSMVSKTVKLEFYEAGGDFGDRLEYVDAVVRLAGRLASESGMGRVSHPLTPTIFPVKVIERVLSYMAKLGVIVYAPLGALEDEIFTNAAKIGVKRSSIEEDLAAIRASACDGSESGGVDTFGPPRRISVAVGPNSLHDMLDGLIKKKNE